MEITDAYTLSQGAQASVISKAKRRPRMKIEDYYEGTYTIGVVPDCGMAGK